MSSDERFAAVDDSTANLMTQLRELQKLRERVRKAELAVRVRRTERRKERSSGGWRLRQIDPKIVDLFSRLKLRGQPARPFPAARPSFRRLRGIHIFRIDRR